MTPTKTSFHLISHVIASRIIDDRDKSTEDKRRESTVKSLEREIERLKTEIEKLEHEREEERGEMLKSRESDGVIMER